MRDVGAFGFSSGWFGSATLRAALRLLALFWLGWRLLRAGSTEPRLDR